MQFIKLTILEDGREEPALIPLVEIYQFRKTSEGIQLWWTEKDADGTHFYSLVKETAGSISKAFESEKLIFTIE